MAKKTTVQTLCNPCLPAETQAVGEPVTFAVDGNWYQIDACARHQPEIDAAVATLIAAGELTSAPAQPRSRPPEQRAASRRARAEAKARGVEVAERGRLPRRAYDPDPDLARVS
jgi:Lsr2